MQLRRARLLAAAGTNRRRGGNRRMDRIRATLPPAVGLQRLRPLRLRTGAIRERGATGCRSTRFVTVVDARLKAAFWRPGTRQPRVCGATLVSVRIAQIYEGPCRSWILPGPGSGATTKYALTFGWVGGE